MNVEGLVTNAEGLVTNASVFSSIFIKFLWKDTYKRSNI